MRSNTLVDSSHHIIVVLAGLNHRYFVPLHFKRMHRFIAQMSVASINLAERLRCSAALVDQSVHRSRYTPDLGDSLTLRSLPGAASLRPSGWGRTDTDDEQNHFRPLGHAH